MELFPFQINASGEIAKKFISYIQDPLAITPTKLVPFYQNLISITGSGKTLILADTVEQIRGQLPVEPIVLWLSKGRVVVWQTYTNLSSGKYSKLLGGYKVKPLLDCRHSDIEKSNDGLILVTTVGKFNQKDKHEGDRKIFKVSLDTANKSLWEMLKNRRDSKGVRRNFIIVYDEGHNLSDQQTDLLLELEPDALIAASATMRIPNALSKIVNRLKSDKNWNDAEFSTVVKSSDVVDSGLVKKHLMLGGYITPMEIAINDMLDNMKRVDKAADELHLQFRPKAIYVTNTNVLAGGKKDNVSVPFKDRLARPIVIWRYLVEKRGIDPNQIAVYCDLKFDKKYPPPASFNLFSGGDSDYDTFISGNYRHIIFNLSLQEGWDDPACYFAYIDKAMGSKDQITQIIGRVIRQPDSHHYRYDGLNTAHFFIRTDEKNVFEDVINDVRKKILSKSPEITLSIKTSSGKMTDKSIVTSNKKLKVPEVSIDTTHAKEPIKNVVDDIEDYRTDLVNTIGVGSRIKVLQTIGSAGKAKEEWVEIKHSNKFTARWIFTREVQKYYAKAINLCDIEEPKFDALVEYNSKAALNIQKAAREVVSQYIAHSEIVQSFENSYPVTDQFIVKSDFDKFKYSVHDGYSGLNSLEKLFARALDNEKKPWFRNPSKGFFEIPLLSNGGSRHFNPDFLIWSKENVLAIDTKGDHLILEAASQKLFAIRRIGKGPNLLIRFVTAGEWSSDIKKLNNVGYTVWKLKSGRSTPMHCKDINQTVKECLNCL